MFRQRQADTETGNNEEVRRSVSKAATRITMREFLDQDPHPFTLLGIILEQEERAGPPKTPEERAERALQWRLCILDALEIPRSEAERTADREAIWGTESIEVATAEMRAKYGRSNEASAPSTPPPPEV